MANRLKSKSIRNRAPGTRALFIPVFVTFALQSKLHMRNLHLSALLLICCLYATAQKSKPTAAPVANDANESAFYTNMQYRLIGPWRGGRSAAVTGSYKNKNTFYFGAVGGGEIECILDRKSTRLNSSHSQISYAVFCLKKKKNTIPE